MLMEDTRNISNKESRKGPTTGTKEKKESYDKQK